MDEWCAICYKSIMNYLRYAHSLTDKKMCNVTCYNDIVACFQIMALFVTKLFSGTPGFSGLFLATLYSGALRWSNYSFKSIISHIKAQTLIWEVGK